MRLKATFSAAAASAIFPLILFAACSKAPSKPAKPVLKVGRDQVQAQFVENESQAVPYWLENGASKRTAVIFSAMDGLAPLKPEAYEEIGKLVKSGDFKALSGKAAPAGGSLYGSNNTAWLAKNLGAVSEIYWVVPAFGQVTENDLQGSKDYLKKEFPDQGKEVDALQMTGDFAQGTINGVPLKIVSLEKMPEITQPVLLEIDLSYLTALYQGEKNTRILAFISGFFVTLRDRNISSDMVTISASNLGGMAPFKFRFAASYLRELFASPKMVDGQPPALWTERAEAWKTEQVSFKDAIPIYKDIIKSYPQDAASHYDLSFAYFQTKDMENCRRELAEAEKLDQGYSGASKEYGLLLSQRGKKQE